jgi:hypothetical protein
VVGVRVHRRPARETVGLALAPGVVVLLCLSVTATGVAAGIVGLAVVGIGTDRGRRNVVTAGCGLLFAGVLLAGIDGAPPTLALFAAAGTVVTWTTAHHAVGLGTQLGREAPVRRSVAMHLAGATIATLCAGGLALGVFAAASGALPPSVLVVLLVGIGTVVYALSP